MSLNPKIYVACLVSYNAGRLHGVWIDATIGVDAIWKEVNKMLSKSPMPNAEEWEIHNTEDFGNLPLHNTEFEDIVDMAGFIVEHGELGIAVLDYASDIEQAKHWMENCYRGEYDSEEDFAREFVADCMEVPDYLINYIDYGSIAYDLFINDVFSIEVGRSIHVFWND